MGWKRRAVLKGLAATIFSVIVLPAYAFFLEPALRLRVKRWRLTHPDWPSDRPLRIAVVSDIHMGEPFVTRERLRRIVARTNALGADLTVILGDLIAGHHFVTAKVPVADTAAILKGLTAPLGVYAILGNHDWWDDLTAQRRRKGPIIAHRALEAEGIPVLENRALKLPNGIWLAGIGSQVALVRRGGGFDGVDDLPGTLAQVPDGAPCVLLIHEPDIFPEVPKRVPLTLAGHTHGGQVRLFGWSPVVPSRFGNRFAYGKVTEEGRHMVVSGGIGTSILPVRFGVVPEITVIEITAA